MAERVDDWELVNPADPVVHRHRNRGSLWLVDGELNYVPAASLSELIAMKKCISEIGQPKAPEPAKPAAPIVEFPKWVRPHESWVLHPSGPPFVEGYKFSVDRDTDVLSVLVKDRADEQRVTAPKQWKK